MLEGGYDLDALTMCSATMLAVMAGATPASFEPPTSGGPGHAPRRADPRLLVAPAEHDDPGPVPSGPRRGRAAHRAIRRGGAPPVPRRRDRARPAARRRGRRRPRLRLHHRRPAGADQGRAGRVRRRDLDAGRAVRHDRRQARRRGSTRSPRTAPTSYHDDSRKPDVEFADAIEADLSRRDFTINALALELTADVADAGRSVRRRGRPDDPHAAHPAGAGGQLQRRSAADAAGRAVHRPAGHEAGARRWSPRSRPCTRGWRSCRPSGSATSSTS